MKIDVDLITKSKKKPIQILASKFTNIPIHMHSTTEILIVLKGSTKLTINTISYNLNEKDVIIINPKVIHELESSEPCIILSTFLNIDDYLDGDKSSNIIFELNSIDYPNNPKYETIRYFIYSLIRLSSQNNINANLNAKSICYSLVAQLMNNFKTDISLTSNSIKEYDTITKITNYLNIHYEEKITLSDLSKHFNYTESHVSKIFKKNLNKTFIDYYDTIRVNYSIDDLVVSNDSIEEIASKHGFENSRSFVRAFKNVYNCYPSEYRKKNKEIKKETKEEKNSLVKEVLDIIMEKYLRYIKRHNIEETVKSTKEVITIDDLSNYSIISNPINKIMSLGDFTFLYSKDVFIELKEIQTKISFKYIKLYNLFSNTMKLYNKIDNSYLLNKPLIDDLAKNLYDLNLTPFFVFSFYDFKNYKELINLFINYFSKSTPYHFKDIIININLDDTYYTKEEKYTYIYQIIYFYLNLKDNNIKLSSNVINSLEDYEIITSINKKENVFDFIDINYIEFNKGIAINEDKLECFIDELNKIYPLKLNNVILENINFTDKVNLLNDTLFKSSYQIRNVINNYDSVYAFVMSEMFDITSSTYFDNSPYLGYNNYFTFNFIAKASFNGLYFLSTLDDHIIKNGRNFIISYLDNKIIIILNNYVHYSKLFAENEYYELTDKDRYKCFPKYTDINFIFEINNINYEKARIKTTYINKKSGSSYDIYQQMSINDSLTYDELHYMKSLCLPGFKVENQIIENNQLKINSTITPLETKLIEIILE